MYEKNEEPTVKRSLNSHLIGDWLRWLFILQWDDDNPKEKEQQVTNVWTSHNL